MNKIVFLLAMVFVLPIAAQEHKPTLEKVGNMVKATYYHENGELAQTGYMLNGKLHGEWLMYNEQGKKMVAGKYDLGKKVGKWFFWEGEILKEVDFNQNKVVQVKEWNNSEIVSVNK